MPSAHAHMPRATRATSSRPSGSGIARSSWPTSTKSSMSRPRSNMPQSTHPSGRGERNSCSQLESLAYARVVLSGDVAILHHCPATRSDEQSLVAELPAVMATHRWATAGPPPATRRTGRGGPGCLPALGPAHIGAPGDGAPGPVRTRAGHPRALPSSRSSSTPSRCGAAPSRSACSRFGPPSSANTSGARSPL